LLDSLLQEKIERIKFWKQCNNDATMFVFKDIYAKE